MRIRTVLCPIDFSGLDDHELTIGIEVCRSFDAKLVLHHDLPAGDWGFMGAGDWTKARQGDMAPEDLAGARLRALMDRVAGCGVPADAVVTSGPLVESLVALAARLRADLMILGSHGWTPDRVSITSSVIDRAPCPVLTFQELKAAPPFRLRALPGEPPLRILVPTDLTPASAAAVAYACSLARRFACHVELLHVIAGDATGNACERAHRALINLVPSDLLGDVETHVRRGEPGTEITRYVAATEPAFVVLGEHARGFLRRFLTPDTTQAVMRRIECPAWVIPANTVAAR